MTNTEKIIGEIPRTDTSKIRVSVKTYEGKVRGDIRLYVQDEAGKSIPTKKGVGVPKEDFDTFLELLNKAKGELVA
jgi:hypothetical protein